MEWGIQDVQDGCWIGDDHGPKLFDDLVMARMAAQMFEMQAFGTDLAARYQAKEFLPQETHLKDEVPVRMDSLTALKKLEGGGALKKKRRGKLEVAWNKESGTWRRGKDLEVVE